MDDDIDKSYENGDNISNISMLWKLQIHVATKKLKSTKKLRESVDCRISKHANAVPTLRGRRTYHSRKPVSAPGISGRPTEHCLPSVRLAGKRSAVSWALGLIC